jgi:hypothetical protein
MDISNRTAVLVALFLLAVMLITAVFSARHDSLTFDERAHIAAGYSYLSHQDFRLNPEHPPLIKDLAALPLLFLNLHFPSASQNWLQDSGPPPWWVQFDVGTEFIYQSGNQPEQIVFWSRIPMIGLTLALGWFLFFWARKLMGNAGALGALGLYAFSPTFLAHGRLVTTDVGAALGAVLVLYFWLEFLKAPTKLAIAKTGIALGLALLMKFTLILLIPFLGLVTIVKNIRYVPHAILIGLAAFVFVIWPVYQLHILNYPPERQVRDTIADMQPGEVQFYEQIFAIEFADDSFLRAPSQFFRGVLMALQRGQFGNTVYFMDHIKAGAFVSYFPIVYLTKVPLAFHILTALGIAGLWLARKKIPFDIWVLTAFAAIYWAVALSGSLNIGIRHLLVLFPLIYLIVMWGIAQLPQRKNIRAGIALLFAAYIGTSLAAFPDYIPYYNELAGGTKNGYTVAVDSNYDWGQDFHHLLRFVEQNKIEQIHLDYFGGESPRYWLDDKYIQLDPKNPPTKGWAAVSVNQLMGGIAKPVEGFDQEIGYYNWLTQHEPVARAGNSIFIYNLGNVRGN